MKPKFTIFTYGDSILDSAKYNKKKTNAALLLARNDDAEFPDFRGQDLASLLACEIALVQNARDGSTTTGLQEQGLSDHPNGPGIALVTVGGNDLIRGMTWDVDELIEVFEAEYREFLDRLKVRPVLIGNLYDPTFGDDKASFLPDEAKNVREKIIQINDTIKRLAEKYGALVDLHSHFLTGTRSWFTWNIEPSLKGASEVRRVFLTAAKFALGIAK